MEKFITLFAEQFDDTQRSLFTPETKFRDLDEWNSLAALLIMAMINEEYNILLKGDEMRGAETIEELYNLVASKL